MKKTFCDSHYLVQWRFLIYNTDTCPRWSQGLTVYKFRSNQKFLSLLKFREEKNNFLKMTATEKQTYFAFGISETFAKVEERG